MGSRRSDWLIICIMFYALVQGSSENLTSDSLDSFLYNYVTNKTTIHHAGKVYDVMPPSNLSGVAVSIVRFRTRSLWMNGVNYSSFTIPTKILPWPFTKRVDLVYQNLGKLSASYYDVPNHTFVAPVLGFLVYNPNKTSPNYGLIDLELMGNDSITISFPNISTQENYNMSIMKCVRFDTNSTLEFSNVTAKSSCIWRKQGHFSVVIPYQEKTDKKGSKMCVIGIVAGVLGLVLIIGIGIVGYTWIRKKRIKKMEKETERSEGLDTIWVAGRSRMPSATGIRTQPVLENSYVP